MPARKELSMDVAVGSSTDRSDENSRRPGKLGRSLLRSYESNFGAAILAAPIFLIGPPNTNAAGLGGLAPALHVCGGALRVTR
jgi:hypothetical protein